MSALHGSYAKFNGSWRPQDSATSFSNNSWHDDNKAEDNSSNNKPQQEEKQEKQVPAWLTQELSTGRPDEYVGGYSPAWIHAYRQRQAAVNPKTIKIEGYNAAKK